MEQLQFSTRPFYTISASVDFDFSSLSQSKSRLTEPERLRQGDNFALPLVDQDASHFKALNDDSGNSFEFFNIWQDDIIVIHIGLVQHQEAFPYQAQCMVIP